MKKRRWLRWWLPPIAVLLSLGVAAWWLLATPGGTQWLLRQVATHASGPSLAIRLGTIDGTVLRRLELGDLEVTSGDARIQAHRVLLHWNPSALLNGQLHLLEIGISEARIALPDAAEETSDAVPEIPDISLPISIRLDRLELRQLDILQGAQVQRIDTLALAAHADQEAITVSDLHLAANSGLLQGQVSMGLLSPHPLAGRIELEAPGELLGEHVAPVKAVLELSGEALSPIITALAHSPVPASLRASVGLKTATPVFDLRVAWEDFDWTLPDGPQLDVSAGTLTLTGSTSDYLLESATAIRGQGIPEANIQLRLQGDTRSLELHSLRLDTLDGSIVGTGKASWGDILAWQLNLDVSGINPGLYDPALDGLLNGRIRSSGEMAESMRMNVLIEQLDGSMQDYPLSASGELAIDGDHIEAKQLKLLTGENLLRLNGRISEPFDATFVIDAPRLDTTLPDLSGTLEGTGHIRGRLSAPELVASLAASDIAYAEHALHTANVQVDWRPGGGTAQIDVKQARSGGLEIDSVVVDLNGPLQQHEMRIALLSDQMSAELAASGGLDDSTWQGTLQRLQLGGPQVGDWALQQPGGLRLGAQQIHIDPLCLQSSSGRACTRGTLEKDRLDFEASLSDVDLGLLGPLLPEEVRVIGTVNAQAKIAGATASPDLTLDVLPSDGSFVAGEDEEMLELPWRDAKLVGRFREDRGTLQLSMLLAGNGKVSGDIELGPMGEATRPLAGNIDVHFPDLALIAGFVPALQELQGELTLQARLDGSTQQPAIHGSIAINDAAAVLPDAGLSLSDTRLVLRGDGTGPLQLEGSARSGKGQVSIEGSVDPFSSGSPRVDLTIRGENFEVVNLPEARVLVSPDLRLQGEQDYQLSGRLEIPRAAIEIEELPEGSVKVSDDEVIVGTDGGIVEESGPQSPVSANIDLALGDEVSLKAFGLDTRLVGGIKAIATKDTTTLVGGIEMADGKYAAYGQDLTIEQGRLLFGGPPDNPDLDIRAKRESNDGDVIAYLTVNGPLNNPVTRVYTEPSLPETEALAYLLTGRSTGQGGAGDVNLADAALALGLARSGTLFQGIGNSFGLDEVRVESGDEGFVDTSVVLGKYLDPNLYVGYTTGLFNPEGAVLVRYRLNERWEVESRSGQTQSVDIFFQHEHD